MFLACYYVEKRIKKCPSKGWTWGIAKKKETIKQFIEENEIENYSIFIDENEYIKLDKRIKNLEEKIDAIKTSIAEIIKGK